MRSVAFTGLAGVGAVRGYARQNNLDGQAGLGVASCDVTTVNLHGTMGDPEPQPDASALSTAVSRDPDEWLVDRPQRSRRDTGAQISIRDPGIAVARLDRDADRRAIQGRGGSRS